MAWNQEVTNLMPGMGTTKVASYKHIWLSSQGILYVPGGGIIDGANSRDPSNTGYIDTLQAGLLMGKITATGKWAPSILGVLTAAYSSGGVTLTVGVACATEIKRRIGSSGSAAFYCVGAPTATGVVAATAVTFSAVSTSAGTVTVTSLGADKTAGSLIMPADGSQTIRSFIDVEDGIHVTLNNDSGDDVQFARIPVAGIVDVGGIINYPAAANTTLIAYVQAALNAVGRFIFSDNL